MSQHLIDTGRHGSALSDEDRTSGVRSNGASERERTGEANGATAHGGNGNGNQSGVERVENNQAASSSGDATLRALDALSAALQEMSKDERLLEERLKDLHRQRAQGRAWNEILGDEDPPGTMQLVSRILACLAKASGTLRKELVDSLRREGVSIPAIARLFGVTHQRVSNLLRRPADPDTQAD
jgi:hypothetical protein